MATVMTNFQTPLPYEIRDSRRRPINITQRDQDYEHFVRPHDGRLTFLKVQVTDSLENVTEDGLKWNRVKMTTKKSYLDKVLYWTWSSTEPGSKAQRFSSQYPYLDVAIKWIPSCTVMLLLFCIPQSIGGEIRNNGFYDPIAERDRYYSKAARNPCERDPNTRDSELGLDDYNENDHLVSRSSARPPAEQRHDHIDPDEYFGIMKRPFRPRLLCYLVKDSRDLSDPHDCYRVLPGNSNDEAYVFISYTRKSFCVSDPDHPDWVERDRSSLLRFAIAATKAAKQNAFWIDFEGIVANDEPRNNKDGTETVSDLSEDVYRICDVVRGACSMVVINGPPNHQKGFECDDFNHKIWLQTWGSRLWVLPELLLAPQNQDLLVYTQTPHCYPEETIPKRYSKRELARIACDDAEEVAQLIDHYTGSTILTPLELIQHSLRCLRRRHTTSRTSADLAYALKGLVRRRPQTTPDESGFEAFASLSLANDSQCLLERLICMLPPSLYTGWADMRDAWGIQLWDIAPSCQVAGIIDDHTILLDGAVGASIHWDRLQSVAFLKRDIAWRTVVRLAVRSAPMTFVTGVLLVVTGHSLSDSGSGPSGNVTGGQMRTSTGSRPNPILVIGALVLSFSLLIVVMAPMLLYKIYMGKLWTTQAWFFGLEGPVEDLAKLERSLFGFCENRLQWSTNSSLLSRHRLNDRYQECEAVPPSRQNITAVVGDSGACHESPTNNVGADQKWKQRLFTIVDTYSLTVTQFYAHHPPTAVFMCGQEGGMQRAVLCSYDWKSRTYCRETVLRMKTLVLEKMFRVDRFRFSMRRSLQRDSDAAACPVRRPNGRVCTRP